MVKIRKLGLQHVHLSRSPPPCSARPSLRHQNQKRKRGQTAGTLLQHPPVNRLGVRNVCQPLTARHSWLLSLPCHRWGRALWRSAETSLERTGGMMAGIVLAEEGAGKNNRWDLTPELRHTGLPCFGEIAPLSRVTGERRKKKRRGRRERLPIWLVRGAQGLWVGGCSGVKVARGERERPITGRQGNGRRVSWCVGGQTS